MVYDQLYLRRRRESGWLPSYKTGRISYEEAVDSGYKQIAALASKIEARTGASLQSRRALDFGCGWGRLALPLAEQCEYVYGMDVSPLVLREAERKASEKHVGNVEWLPVDRLAELSGRYDLVLSVLVFQHIPVDEGERLFATLVQGLRPGGVGLIDLVLRPDQPVRGLFRSIKRSVAISYNPLKMIRDRDRSSLSPIRGYLHLLKGAYSLNRIGRLLADAGIQDWYVELQPAPGSEEHDVASVIFRKPG